MLNPVRALVLLFAKLARPSVPLDDEDRPHVPKFCESILQVLLEEAQEFLGRHTGDPVVVHYQNDGSQYRTAVRVALGAGTEATHREGTTAPEYLSERMFVACHPSMDLRPMRVILRPFRAVHGAINSWHAFFARVMFYPTLYELGHRSYGIYLYTFDRKLWSKQSPCKDPMVEAPTVSETPSAWP